MKNRLPLIVIALTGLLIGLIWLTRPNPKTRPATAKPPAPATMTLEVSPTARPEETRSPLPAFIPAEMLERFSTQAGWTVLIPAWIPDGYSMGEPYFDATNRQLSINFIVQRPLSDSDPALTEMKSITLVQSPRGDAIPLTMPDSLQREDLSINGQPAVLFTGAWDTAFVPDPANPSGGAFESTWRDDLEYCNLYWQAGVMHLDLVTNDSLVSPADLVRIAESVH